MAGYLCRGRVVKFSVWRDYIALGCEGGWAILYNRFNGLLWSKKYVATYYRGPFEDVGISSINIDDDLVAFGTDWMDGKVYVYNFKGDLLWNRQFISIMGCWERPEDVTHIYLNKSLNLAIVGTEWINTYIHVYDVDGELIKEYPVDGSIRDIKIFNGEIVVGTSKHLYIGVKRRMKIDISRLSVHNDRLYVAGDKGLYIIDSRDRIVHRIKSQYPVCEVFGDKILVHNGESLTIFREDFSIIGEYKVPKPIKIGYLDGEVLLGYEDSIYILNSEGSLNKVLDVIGDPVYIGEYVVSVDENRLYTYDLKDIINR